MRDRFDFSKIPAVLKTVIFQGLLKPGVRCARIDMYFCWSVAGHLEANRLQAAAQRLLDCFPSLGSRLDVSGAPSLDFRALSFPISFARWPSGSAGQLVGLKALPIKPNWPIFEPMEVQPA